MVQADFSVHDPNRTVLVGSVQARTVRNQTVQSDSVRYEFDLVWFSAVFFFFFSDGGWNFFDF